MELDEYDYSHNTIWNTLKKDLEIHYKRAYEILNINPQEIDSNELNMKSIKPYSINISLEGKIQSCSVFGCLAPGELELNAIL